MWKYQGLSQRQQHRNAGIREMNRYLARPIVLLALALPSICILPIACNDGAGATATPTATPTPMPEPTPSPTPVSTLTSLHVPPPPVWCVRLQTSSPELVEVAPSLAWELVAVAADIQELLTCPSIRKGEGSYFGGPPFGLGRRRGRGLGLQLLTGQAAADVHRT